MRPAEDRFSFRVEASSFVLFRAGGRNRQRPERGGADLLHPSGMPVSPAEEADLQQGRVHRPAEPGADEGAAVSCGAGEPSAAFRSKRLLTDTF